jgi:curved DNA-binding protein CbpA
MNAFEILGIETRLALSDEALREAFREAGRHAHPDGGGGEEQFARLRHAFELLLSPSRRLAHWLELQGIVVESRGTLADGLMDMFSMIGQTTQRAEALIRKRGQAMSALGRALLEPETQACREEVEAAMRHVEEAIAGECAAFPRYEQEPEADAAALTVRNLAFLEKWRATLRGLFARLV